jgi:hypothetical protein
MSPCEGLATARNAGRGTVSLELLSIFWIRGYGAVCEEALGVKSYSGNGLGHEGSSPMAGLEWAKDGRRLSAIRKRLFALRAAPWRLSCPVHEGVRSVGAAIAQVGLIGPGHRSQSPDRAD